MKREFSLPFQQAFRTYAQRFIAENSYKSYFAYLKSLNDNFFQVLSDPDDPSPFEMLSPRHLRCNTLQNVVDALYDWKSRLDSEIHQPQYVTLSPKYMQNWMSAYSKYISFIEDYFNLNEVEDSQEAQPSCSQPSVDSQKKAELKARKRLYGETLKESCKTRLRGQDRMSLSRKANLPINFISQVLQSNSETAAGKTLINDWVKYLSKRITALAEKDGSMVEIPIDKIKLIRLYKDQPATIELSDSNKQFTMLTRTANGEIRPMHLSRENEMHIDHEPSIDKILIDYADEFPTLTKISDMVKNIAERNGFKGTEVHDSGLADCIKKDQTASSEIIRLLPGIKDELYLLSSKFNRLELMHFSENCSKSNR